MAAARQPRQGRAPRSVRQARVMSHRARRLLAPSPDEAVARVAAEVGRAFEAWASRFVDLVVRDLLPTRFVQDQLGVPVTARTLASVLHEDATIQGLFEEAGRASPRKEVLESAFKMVDKQSADEMRVAGVRTADVVPGLPAKQAAWVRSNTDLIKAEQDLRRRVERVIADPLNEGRSVKDIAKLLQEQAGYSKSRAELTARDQTLKLYGRIQEDRQRAAGITRYVWTTSLDERVRKDHAELDGTVQAWDDPPVTDKRAQRRGHPGSDIQCRCTAVPILDEDDVKDPQVAQERRAAAAKAEHEGRFRRPGTPPAPTPPPPAPTPPPPARPSVARRPPPPEPVMQPTQAELDLARRQADAEARRRQLEAEADARIAAARAEAERQARAQAEADRAARAEAERQAQAVQAEQARAEAERQARAQAEADARQAAQARAEAERRRQEAEAARKVELERARLEQQRREQAERERRQAEALRARLATPSRAPPVKPMAELAARIDVDPRVPESSRNVVERALQQVGLPQMRILEISERIPRSTSNGDYAPWTGTLRVASTRPASRKPLPETPGPGKLWSMSSTGQTMPEAVRLTTLHELGHHAHMWGMQRFEHDGAVAPHRQRVAALKVDRVVEDLWSDPKREYLTDYAGVAKGTPDAYRSSEYFAEAHAAYHAYPDWLKRVAPKAYQAVEEVLRLRREADL